MELTHKTAVITGGASGLGRAVAELFLRSGAKALILDLPGEQNQKSAAALGEGALFVGADVSSETAVSEALEAGAARFGGIHIAVNCAGIAFVQKTLQQGRLAELSAFETTLRVNLTGTFNVCRLAAKYMSENTPNGDGERGVIVNTASIAAFDGQVGQTGYAASKGGIVSLTLPLARDLAPYGIRVMAVAPGIFDTPLLAKLPEPARLSLAAQVPFPKRLGHPLEYAALVKHIVENPMLNGEVIRLDAALRMGMK